MTKFIYLKMTFFVELHFRRKVERSCVFEDQNNFSSHFLQKLWINEILELSALKFDQQIAMIYD